MLSGQQSRSRDNDSLFLPEWSAMNGEIWVLNKARGRVPTCICLCIGLGIGEGRTQLTVNERRASVGDAPGDPGALVADISPVLQRGPIQAAMRKVANWQYARIADTPSRDWTFATLYLGMLAASRTL